ncbi:MAG: cobalt-precorrin-5B (C(1))-methyltransferase, partial [Alteromonadaceae bacterium]
MWKESGEQNKPLRTGLTTGTCATACAAACARFLLTGNKADTVSVILPKGQVVELSVNTQYLTAPNTDQTSKHSQTYSARSSTIKNAGDDPDVTHGATIFVLLNLSKTPGIKLLAGEGVGTVTREGLALAVGEPAINPVPRQMIIDHLNQVAQQYHYLGGFTLAVGVENGEAIALKTMNGRLGIIGGLSILGTTGIVRPFSCAAWIASITQGIDVAKACGLEHIAASTGNRSEHAIKSWYNMQDMALIEMGDFAGAVLKHLKKHPIK